MSNLQQSKYTIDCEDSQFIEDESTLNDVNNLEITKPAYPTLVR